MEDNAEFDGERASRYEIAIAEDPLARLNDIDSMFRYLDPRKGERILGFGEGNGYFCKDIAESVGSEGYYLITDPSKDQLNNLKKRVNLSQIETKVIGVEGLDVKEGVFDKVWSFGAFHHVPNQTEAMKRIHRALKPEGKLILCDVFQGSNLARHFDSQVARYCITGHEVKFLSGEFARTLCHLAGFDEGKVDIRDLPQKWIFDSERRLGSFIYNLHAMTNMGGSEDENIRKTLGSCKDILGVNPKNGKYELNWPMKVLIAKK